MKKNKIIALAGILISVGIIIGLLFYNVRPYLRVSQLDTNPKQYYNKEVQVIGIVQNLSASFFILAENQDQVFVDASKISIPSDVVNSMEVVVTGIFNASNILIASEILTQCS